MERVRVAATQMLVRHRASRENLERHLALIDTAARQDVRLILFPELSLTGHNGSPEVVRDACGTEPRALKAKGRPSWPGS
jgi:predicted amidohydrolase